MYVILQFQKIKNKKHFSTTQSKNFLAPHCGQLNVSKYSAVYTLQLLNSKTV